MIDTRAGAIAQFQDIKSQIRQRADNPELVKVSGEVLEVLDSFQVSSPDGDYTVQKFSYFDNDPKSKDRVSVLMAPREGIEEKRVFENFPYTKFVFFTEDRLRVSSEIGQAIPGGWTSSSSTHEFKL